jgi:hypothetical protein
MHKRWHVMHPSPQGAEVRWRFETRSEPDALALGVVRGAAVRLSAWCACSSEHWSREDAA